MAVVVIVIMFGFIGSDYLQWIGRGRARHQTVAYFLDNKKITNDDLVLARQELETLKALRADDFLRSQDLGGILLGRTIIFRTQNVAGINQSHQTSDTN